ncbi:Hypothetical predicted protein [Mytilus galloprovincialis]|uniref:Uncharacterized protein n=1 Tax=Mytilus galloprovincialis TaxID=29158 RepID=A0A8B6GBV5_MYTGA|nr:Hypothetical predicted protein [Mytilus galloprovincialis]
MGSSQLAILLVVLIRQVYSVCQNGDCGWKASCVNKSCECPVNYTIYSNQYDCVQNGCTQDDCLECDPQLECIRCSKFIDELTRECLDKCVGETKVISDGLLQGNVCKQTESTDSTELIIAVACGVAGGVILCVVVTLIFYCHYKHTRKKINLQQQKYKPQNMQLGNLTQIPVFDNKGFGRVKKEQKDENDVLMGSSAIDNENYNKELQKLMPQAPTLLAILNNIRSRLRSMDLNDPRVPTYRGVIHQLCRVLVLLNKTDPRASIPSDAPGLLQWAQQMLEDYQMDVEDQHLSGGSDETPVSKISYIDVPIEQQKSHQYAVPQLNKATKEEERPVHHHQPFHHSQQSSLSHHSDTGYYSSTPVPVEYRSTTLPHAQINSSFTTFTSKKQKKHDPRLVRSSTNIAQYPRDNSQGYFANGRYYDPSPKPEVYAPASSYSDRDNKVMSTFLSDLPQDPGSSVSSSDSSLYVDAEENDNNDLDSLPEDEVLPFDPEEATDPVEV